MILLMFFAGRGKDGQAMRARIRQAIDAEPGIHVSELADRLGISWHTAAYHLGVLDKAHLVQLEKGERERRAYPVGIPPRHRQWLAALRTEQAAEVLRVLLEDPRLSVPGISRRMGYSEKIVRRQVARLAEAGLVQRHGSLRPVYEPSPQAATAVEAFGLDRRARAGTGPEAAPGLGPGLDDDL